MLRRARVRWWPLIVALPLLGPFAPAARADATNPYASAPFAVTTHSYTFSQAPVFMPDGRVAVGLDPSTGWNGNNAQVYLSNFNGSGQKCLTCELPAPNDVPATRPQGDWILFHSWMGHHFTFGSPGYGGFGSALFVMRPDGSAVTRLTGLDPSKGSGEGEDDYHAYWSPNGRQVEWAHFNGQFLLDGGLGYWDVRVADFVDDGHSPPHLANIRIVRPDNGHWYETQWWAPDGSGFLYTETFGSAVNPELFFCRLTAAGCQVTRLTNNPAWDEQAIFTPDGKDVIFMSSRDHPGFFNTYSQAAQDAGLTSGFDNFLVLPIFEAGFEQPVAQEATDLYELDLATGSLRRLTTDGDAGWITPEVAWDPTNKFLMWTEARITPGASVLEPVDLAHQLQDEVALLQHPPPVPTSPNDSATAPIESRTRILRFDLGAAVGAVPQRPTCIPARRLRFALHHGPGARVVRVEVFVDGRHVLTRRGHALKDVTLTRPTGQRFVVRIVNTQSTGSTVTTLRTYTLCTKKTRPRQRVHRVRRRARRHN
jgi:Tol biopolymer transport system component